MNWSVLVSPIVQGSIDGWTQTLETSNNVEMFRPSGQWDLARGLVIMSPWETDHLCPYDSSGSTGLIPPSHFQVRPLPTLPRMAPRWVSDIPLVQPPAHQDVLERRPDNQRPQVTMWGQEVSGKGQEPGWRGRYRSNVAVFLGLLASGASSLK